MDILKTIIYQQNLEFLTRIANDMYIEQEDKEKFIKKYHKKNFTSLKVVKRDTTPKYVKKLIRCVK